MTPRSKCRLYFSTLWEPLPPRVLKTDWGLRRWTDARGMWYPQSLLLTEAIKYCTFNQTLSGNFIDSWQILHHNQAASVVSEVRLMGHNAAWNIQIHDQRSTMFIFKWIHHWFHYSRVTKARYGCNQWRARCLQIIRNTIVVQWTAKKEMVICSARSHRMLALARFKEARNWSLRWRGKEAMDADTGRLWEKEVQRRSNARSCCNVRWWRKQWVHHPIRSGTKETDKLSTGVEQVERWPHDWSKELRQSPMLKGDERYVSSFPMRK